MGILPCLSDTSYEQHFYIWSLDPAFLLRRGDQPKGRNRQCAPLQNPGGSCRVRRVEESVSIFQARRSNHRLGMFNLSWINNCTLTLLQCYEFAVKSYVNGWEDIYKLESEAFRGVRNHKGVVKYLGE